MKYLKIKQGLSFKIDFYNNKQIYKIEFYNKYNQLHREKGPALIIWYENGTKCLEEYWFNGKKHRIDGPAEIHWYFNGVKKTEKYWLNNLVFRKKGPAETHWYENGNKAYEYYLQNWVFHNEDGPAVIKYDLNGVIIEEKFYINGKQLSKEDWFKAIILKKIEGDLEL